MAHAIEEFDSILSVRETPWHGIGIVLDDYVEVKEAQKLANLNWYAQKTPVTFNTPTTSHTVEDQFILYRDDINIPLGVVGNRYNPYQNEEMFNFMERFVSFTNSKIETCGSLFNGKIVWALTNSNDSYEVLSNDPIKKFFLFKNSFDGKSSLEICFTDIRVVCNNTLNYALIGAQNVHRIKHLISMRDNIAAIENTMRMKKVYDDKLKEAFKNLTNTQVNDSFMKEAIIHTFKPNWENNIPEAFSINEYYNQLLEKMDDKVTTIFNLVQSGSGADIQGVRGTAYGFVQAMGEYFDHHATFYTNKRKTSQESRFNSIMFGKSNEYKQRMFSYVMANAA